MRLPPGSAAARGLQDPAPRVVPVPPGSGRVGRPRPLRARLPPALQRCACLARRESGDGARAAAAGSGPAPALAPPRPRPSLAPPRPRPPVVPAPPRAAPLRRCPARRLRAAALPSGPRGLRAAARGSVSPAARGPARRVPWATVSRETGPRPRHRHPVTVPTCARARGVSVPPPHAPPRPAPGFVRAGMAGSRGVGAGEAEAGAARSRGLLGALLLSQSHGSPFVPPGGGAGSRGVPRAPLVGCAGPPPRRAGCLLARDPAIATRPPLPLPPIRDRASDSVRASPPKLCP